MEQIVFVALRITDSIKLDASDGHSHHYLFICLRCNRTAMVESQFKQVK